MCAYSVHCGGGLSFIGLSSSCKKKLKNVRRYSLIDVLAVRFQVCNRLFALLLNHRRISLVETVSIIISTEKTSLPMQNLLRFTKSWAMSCASMSWMKMIRVGGWSEGCTFPEVTAISRGVQKMQFMYMHHRCFILSCVIDTSYVGSRCRYCDCGSHCIWLIREMYIFMKTEIGKQYSVNHSKLRHCFWITTLCIYIWMTFYIRNEWKVSRTETFTILW